MPSDHDIEILHQLAEQSAKLEAIRVSVDQLRKYFLYKFIMTVALIFLPLAGLVVTLPKILAILNSQLSTSLAPLEQLRTPQR